MDMEWWANTGPQITKGMASTARSEAILAFTVTPLHNQILRRRGFDPLNFLRCLSSARRSTKIEPDNQAAEKVRLVVIPSEARDFAIAGEKADPSGKPGPRDDSFGVFPQPPGRRRRGIQAGPALWNDLVCNRYP
jgi:hypothetical protein